MGGLLSSSSRNREHRKAADHAGLVYVTDGAAGISRRRSGTGWTYYTPDGERIRDAAAPRRPNSLATRSYGLTTLRRRHVSVKGSTLRFTFRGKSGIEHSIALNDLRLAHIVQRCRDLPGQEMFQYVDAFRRRQSITSDDVNDYLREISGREITAKDFRTWGGTMLAALELRTIGPASSRG